MRLQAAYNNTSEIELEGSDIGAVVEPSSSLFPVCTRVAKQCDGADGELVWFEGEVQRYDEDLYWVLYSDGDSEDMDASEVRDAVDLVNLLAWPNVCRRAAMTELALVVETVRLAEP